MEASHQGVEVHHGEQAELLPEAQCHPKLGQHPGLVESDGQSDMFEVTAGNVVAVAPSPTSLEPTLDVGGSEQQPLQQITDSKMPKGAEQTALYKKNSYLRSSPYLLEEPRGTEHVSDPESQIMKSENNRHALEVSGSTVQQSCNNQQDLHNFSQSLEKPRKVPLVRNAPMVKPVRSHALHSRPLTPCSGQAASKPAPLPPACQALPRSSHHSTPDTSINRGSPEPPKTPKVQSPSSLRPAPPFQPVAPLRYKDLSESPKTTKKMLPECQPEWQPLDEELELRNSAGALVGDVQILGVIEAYHTSAKTLRTLDPSSGEESAPQVVRPGTESAGHAEVDERSLVEAVAALKGKIQDLREENEKVKGALEGERRVLKDLETLARNVLKNMKLAWGETGV
uniref:Rho guanine nucleotide exchange factor 6/7 coiled-coil domain-containing protein n=1 Tax=Molossus molossus TaxID=27622 RepID=A0A7J8E2U1_MOLMO|nr:hypothetical protein HJG59_009054 [Molossus molossus]